MGSQSHVRGGLTPEEARRIMRGEPTPKVARRDTTPQRRAVDMPIVPKVEHRSISETIMPTQKEAFRRMTSPFYVPTPERAVELWKTLPKRPVTPRIEPERIARVPIGPDPTISVAKGLRSIFGIDKEDVKPKDEHTISITKGVTGIFAPPITWAKERVTDVGEKYEKIIDPVVERLKTIQDYAKAYAGATDVEGAIRAVEKTQGRKFTHDERIEFSEALEAGQELSGKYRQLWGLPHEKTGVEIEAAKLESKVKAGEFALAAEQYGKQIIDPISVKAGGPPAKAKHDQQIVVNKNIKNLEDELSRHPEWVDNTGAIILPSQLKPGVEKAAETNPNRYVRQDGVFKEQYVEFTSDAKRYMNLHKNYTESQSKLDSLPGPGAGRQFLRGGVETLASLPIMPIVLASAVGGAVIAPTDVFGKAKQYLSDYWEFAKGEPFRFGGQATAMLLTGPKGKVVSKAGEAAGIVRKRVHVVKKGDQLPTMSRGWQVETILEKNYIKGTRTTTQPVGKKIKIRDPGEVGDIPAGVQGGYMTIGRSTMYETGEYFLTKPKTSFKGTVLGSRIYELNVRTVKLSPELKNKIYDSIRTTGVFDKYYPEILKIAKKQSMQHGEPIAVPSPKRAKGYPERDPTAGVGMSMVPENEAFMVFATDISRKVTSKRLVGFTDDGYPIQQLRYGNQPKIVGKGIPIRENIAYNIRAKENYLKAATEQMQRKVDELYGGKLKYPVEYEFIWKHGLKHSEAVERNMLYLRDLYPSLKNLSNKEIHLIAKYHDIAKVTWHETTPLEHAAVAAAAIRKNLLKDPLLEGLTQAQRNKIARAIQLHTKIKPNFLHEIIYGPTPAAKALATADRMDLIRFGTVVDATKLFKFKSPRARIELSNFYKSWVERLKEFVLDEHGKVILKNFMKEEDKIISRMIKNGQIYGYKGKIFSYKYSRGAGLGYGYGAKPGVEYPSIVGKPYKPVTGKPYKPVSGTYDLAPTQPYPRRTKPYKRPAGGKPYRPKGEGYRPVGTGYLESIGYKSYKAAPYTPPGLAYTPVPEHKPYVKPAVRRPILTIAPILPPIVEKKKKFKEKRKHPPSYYKYKEKAGILLPHEVKRKIVKKESKKRPTKQRSRVEAFMFPA